MHYQLWTLDRDEPVAAFASEAEALGALRGLLDAHPAAQSQEWELVRQDGWGNAETVRAGADLIDAARRYTDASPS